MTSTSRRTRQLEPRVRAALVCSVEGFLASVAIQARADMAVDNEAVGLSRATQLPSSRKRDRDLFSKIQPTLHFH